VTEKKKQQTNHHQQRQVEFETRIEKGRTLKAEKEQEVKVVDGHINTAMGKRKSLALGNYLEPSANDHPDQIIKQLGTKKKDLERQGWNLKSEIENIHLEWRKQIETDRASLSAEYYAMVHEPQESQFAEIVNHLQEIFSRAAAVVTNAQSNAQSGDFQSEDVKHIDLSIDALNKSGVECGIPSNLFRIPEGEKLGKALAALAEVDVRKLMIKIKQIMEDFHRKVEADWKKKNPEQAKLVAGLRW
jgi:hypothetical protein